MPLRLSFRQLPPYIFHATIAASPGHARRAASAAAPAKPPPRSRADADFAVYQVSFSSLRHQIFFSHFFSRQKSRRHIASRLIFFRFAFFTPFLR
jgi:hypothetical protein